MAKLARHTQENEASLGMTVGAETTQTEPPASSFVLEAESLGRKTMSLPQEQYQALVDLLDSPLTREEIKGRKRLEAVPEWER